MKQIISPGERELRVRVAERFRSGRISFDRAMLLICEIQRHMKSTDRSFDQLLDLIDSEDVSSSDRLGDELQTF